VLPDARPTDLLPAWERFALPLRSAHATGGGTLPAAGSLLEVRGAELSGVRRREGELVATIWNATGERLQAQVGRQSVELRPAAIATVPL
jgi:hypothetical protein